MMTAVTKLVLGLLAATVAAESRGNMRFSPLLISSLVAATADAAYLRKAGQSRDSASDSRPESRRLDDADCMDDPEWYHKNRGPEYDCAWVALKTDTRCSVKGVSGKVSLVLNLATNADGVEDPQPIFDYAATGACAAVDE